MILQKGRTGRLITVIRETMNVHALLLPATRRNVRRLAGDNYAGVLYNYVFSLHTT